MRDAIGGLVSINIIIFFLFLVNGYLALSVNYTKATRMKNYIVKTIEAYEGHTTGGDGSTHDAILKYAQANHYFAKQDFMPSTTTDYCCYGTNDGSYCIHATLAGTSDNPNDDDYRGYNYQVITFVNLDIPIFNKLLSVKNNGEPIFKGMLWVKGETSSVRGTVGANYLHGCG